MSAEEGSPIEILNLGLRDYEEVWELQRERQRALIEKQKSECIIFCSHPPTITLGKSSKREHVLISPEEMRQRGIKIFEVERGGDVTYHGPGQLVCYPIVNLSLRKRDVSWYMRLLEEAVIRTLREFSLNTYRISGKTGVWIKGIPDRKIASIGVRLSRWCSMHGLALNVLSSVGERDLITEFSVIHPCGFSDIEITTLEKESLKRPEMNEVEATLQGHIIELLLDWQSFQSPS